jgi:hypothetical protein
VSSYHRLPLWLSEFFKQVCVNLGDPPEIAQITVLSELQLVSEPIFS